MSVYSKFNNAVNDGVKKGTIDRTRQGAIISAGRKLAKIMDDPSWPMINGKIDNVSPSVFLKYCEKLGIAECAGQKGTAKPDQQDKGKLVSLVGNSKWKRTGNG